MKQGFAADESHRDLHHTAASWHGLFEDRVPTSTEREQFEAWLDADPRHRAAYDSIDCSWDFVAAAAVDERVMAMRREALAAPGKRSVSWGRPLLPHRLSCAYSSLGLSGASGQEGPTKSMANS
jgi:ferric-dicitrate binding protein FerR (iron transport regulator)